MSAFFGGKRKNMRVLFGASKIRKRVRALARGIVRDCGGGGLLCVCVLGGASLFFADLAREFDGASTELDFIRVSSYGGGKTSGGAVELTAEPAIDPRGKRVLIVEDIVDTGRTLEFLRGYFLGAGAKSVACAALLDKPFARVNAERAEYTAFTLKDDAFAVGYGLDLDQRYRNLKAVYALEDGAK
ncbi:MAG: hypoxanthine phosphoribosyltransferase [Clostridiales bacterium]|jgi:hypoxanthine phosphoribosyltransferase|nr:hypoxanthine phosphoribosyltransferase [Clostridiales bacterium]